MSLPYTTAEPTRSEVDAWPGPAVIEFGSPSCGVCRSIEPVIAQGLAGHRQVLHLRVADGPGRPLGRSYGVKLWPTLVFLKDGQEVARLVRPREPGLVGAALATIVA